VRRSSDRDLDEGRDARMRPILYVIPGWDFKVHSYGVMVLFACFAALAIGVWRARRERIHSDVVYELATWLFLGGVVGARGLYVLSHLDTIHNWGDVLRSWQGGNNFYGCILGGLTGSVLYWFRRPFPFWLMTDVAAPAVAIGIAIGRIGCFLNGCCYGAVCDRPWAVCFPAGSHAWVRQVDAGLISPWATISLPVHPTQIYASFAGFALLGLLLAYFPRRRVAGEVMAVLMIVYPLTRWPLEALRGDEPAILAGMTLSQNISVGLFACGLAAWFGLRGWSPFMVERGWPSPPVRSPVRFRLGVRHWAWHWHPDESSAPGKGKTASDQIGSGGAGQTRST
jgi:phosphatidylglycerol:prolipoprotein diacylglycerol transferase